jgi:PKD repeat protein
LDGENAVGATMNSGALTTNILDSLGQIGIKDESGAFLNQPYSTGSLGEICIPLWVGTNNFTLVADEIFPGNEKYGSVLFFDGVPTAPQIAVCNFNGGTGEFLVQPAGTGITGSANGGLLLDKAPGKSEYIAPDGTKIEVLSFVVNSKSGITDEVSGGDPGSNGTPDTTAKLSLKVTPPVAVPVAAFSTSPGSGNAPLKVAFTDASTGFPAFWNWNFGDGTASTGQNTVHIYNRAGNYTATLIAGNGNGTNSTSAIITVSEQAKPLLPVANFSSNITSGYAALPVQFTDLSENATQWNWDFGDGAFSTERNPAHVYYVTGNYTITLTVINVNGKSAKTSQIIVSKSSDDPNSENNDNSTNNS